METDGAPDGIRDTILNNSRHRCQVFQLMVDGAYSYVRYFVLLRATALGDARRDTAERVQARRQEDYPDIDWTGTDYEHMQRMYLAAIDESLNHGTRCCLMLDRAWDRARYDCQMLRLLNRRILSTLSPSDFARHLAPFEPSDSVTSEAPLGESRRRSRVGPY